MKRATHLIICCCYYYAQLLGVLNFSYDCRTRRAYKNAYVTVYAGIMNVALFGVIPYLAMTMKLKSRPAGSAELIYKLSVTILFIRTGGALLTVISNWTKRNEFIRLINEYQHFCEDYLEKCQKWNKFMKYFERRIRIKCQTSLASDIIMSMASLSVFRDIFEISNSLIWLALAVMPIILNITMTQYYFALQTANVLLVVINEELEGLLKLSQQCVHANNTHIINAKHISSRIINLSDYVNVLAGMVIQLENYIKRFNRIYDIQGVCCMLTLYVNSICVIYLSFMTSAPEKLWSEWHSLKGFLTLLSLVMHYFDLTLFVMCMLDASNLVIKLGKLLTFKQSLHSVGHLCLERSLMNFALQVAAFPLEIDLVGLYRVNRPMVLTVLGSTIANSIVLMQYDFKYK